MELLQRVFLATWHVYLIASPYILLGLAAAGLMHVLIPADRIVQWLGGRGLGAATRAALLGIPLPLCSCAVVPVTIELSRKGASREASLAFLVSTPETGVDSILLTYGLMGPVMAIVRPIAALLTSLVAAVSSLVWRRARSEGPTHVPAEPPACDCDTPTAAGATRSWSNSLRDAIHHGFIEMVDEIGFWLVVGLLLTGVITALVPEEFIRTHLGEGPASLLILLVLGVPLYMCASASTPIGAALLLKGISPGAALVFLLAGPATNASSLVVIARFFGKGFVALYLSSVVVTALAAGWIFDLLVERSGLTLEPILTSQAEDRISALDLTSALLLATLLLWSVARGSWKMATRDLRRDIGSWRELLRREGSTEVGLAGPTETNCQHHSPENEQGPEEQTDRERLVEKERSHQDRYDRHAVSDQRETGRR